MSDDAFITPEFLLAAYAKGYFPMAESAESDTLHWYYPEKRGVLPLDGFHVPESLAKFMRKKPFEITTDKAFADVMRGCQERSETWINQRIIMLYTALHDKGYAHSMECWKDGTLIGGIYGITLGGAFFGESMFSRVPNGSKVALATLVERLQQAGYQLFDAQYVNAHLKQFGVLEISRKNYLKQLNEALLITPGKCF